MSVGPILLGALVSGLGPAEPTEASTSTPEARAAAQTFGECLADRSPELSAETLRRDFRTTAYKNSLLQLARVNEGCFRTSGTMRSGGLLIAGAMAERLLERGSVPVNVQLARAAMEPAPQPRTPAEAVAICLVRSVPDDVGRLLATEVASEAETAALRGIDSVARLCNRSGHELQISDAGMRSILAAAAFRSVQGGNQASEAGN
ncbi:hypothetical protein [Sphingosinicella sp. CPCC 101087]|uniref:hypothetical protein n=1 Tax=Sphingosinicella sp. CPCC 101087 TaxID=2497754 RepID=UPI00101DB828|nr:hypothetical protein [Sphingosinicella sp. CPCC 101087]